MITFQVYGIPVPKGSTTPFPIMKNGKPVLSKTGRPVVVTQNANPKTKDWQRQIAVEAQQHRPDKLINEAIIVTLKFFLMRPGSVSEKKRPLPTVTPDIDKLARTALDAMTGVIFTDDKVVCDLQATKEYGDSPGVHVEIRRCINDGEQGTIQ